MTEDDTFKLLRRVPFNDMLGHYRNLNDIEWNRMSDGQVKEFFKKYGWTEYEFRNHWYEKNIP